MQKNRPKVLFTVKITAYDNGDVQVGGFPSEHRSALAILHSAVLAVSEHFIRIAKTGKEPEPKRIIVPSQLMGKQLRPH